MENEVFTEGALLDLSDQLVGKPIIIFKDGKKRQVGVIRNASYNNGDISITGEVTDESVAGFLNAETQRLSVST